MPVNSSNNSPRSLAGAFKKAANPPCANNIDFVKREKSNPVISTTCFKTSLTLLAIIFPLSSANSAKGGCNLPKALFLARLCPQKTRYFLPLTANSTSASQSPVPRVISSFLLCVILSKRGVCWYKAKHSASKIVLLPAPVCPVITNNPLSTKACD